MPDFSIKELMAQQREFFASGVTLGLRFREEALRSLLSSLRAAEGEIYSALKADLGKSAGEDYITELGLLCAEIKLNLKNLRRWVGPRRVSTPLADLPGKSRVYPEPFGLTLNISPWNYPLHLSLMPLISALAAGNGMIIKPSSKAPATAALLDKIISGALPQGLASVVQGGSDTAQALLAERFDFIFYTGSARVGKSVMHAAAEHLSPVCLELGGKSPAIVLEDARLEHAARAIAWGKTLNAGQTCVAPDYVLAAASVKDRLLSLLAEEFKRFPGPEALRNEAYARIINAASLERLVRLSNGRAEADPATLRMAPLLMPEALPGDPVMQEEIFGPLLPVLEISGPEEAVAFVNGREKPLAAYIFTSNKQSAASILARMPFGGGCVNDTMLHMANPGLPFGGAGNSGLGRYHGQAGFDLFSNLKGVLHKPAWPDLPLRYPPYSASKLRWLKKILQ